MTLPQFHRQPVLLRATYHINTPMFVAGENRKEAELTPTAFKGVMRFWWRALNWSKICLELLEKSENLDKKSALKELHRQEAKLFGLASKNNQGGQGECLVNALQINGNKKWSLPDNKNGLNYLLGQGLCKNSLTRSALANNQSFTIKLTVTKSAESSIIDVLKLIGLFGSFGSRSRHGFGSVTLTELGIEDIFSEEYQPLQFEQEPIAAIKSLLTTYRCKENKELPPLSAFYADTRIDIVTLKNNNNSIELLNAIGQEQQLYRSYGSKNPRTNKYEVNGKNPEQNFEDDHDLILKYINHQDRNLNLHPRRSIFGLPHNYRYSSGKKLMVNVKDGRRSSPLIQHIHRQQNNSFCLIQCLLKSEFLPSGQKIEVGRSRVDVNIDWQVIETFMNRGLFATKETI